ncbi:uncharacterized protein LOC112906116, partial [Agrilus planipennis]|uniref:Uncharacterized protein LOC112906116 n=1 Tax=Agrilus planipennis TaxID=224129 RepID=A0A7F5RHW0_AGRPL
GQSCRKDADDGTSFEAKELEYGQLDKRIQKLEEEMNKQLSDDITSKEIEKLHSKIEDLDKDMDNIKKETELYKNDLRSFKNELYFIEKRVKNVDEVWKKGEFLKKRSNLLLPLNSY